MSELREAAEKAYYRLQSLRAELSKAHYLLSPSTFSETLIEQKCRMGELNANLRAIDVETEALRQALENDKQKPVAWAKPIEMPIDLEGERMETRLKLSDRAFKDGQPLIPLDVIAFRLSMMKTPVEPPDISERLDPYDTKVVVADPIHYTSPPIRELSEEEVRRVWLKCYVAGLSHNQLVYKFAKELMKKMQGDK